MNLLLNWLHLPVFFLLVYLLWPRKCAAREQWLFGVALTLKLAAGLALGWLYLHSLPGGDTWGYQKQALTAAELAQARPDQYLQFLFFDSPQGIETSFTTFSNSFFFLKILSLLHLLTGGSYWGSSLYLSLFSFAGCWFLVRQVSRFYSKYEVGAAVAFLLFPSVVFWTSGVSKDSAFMGSLCFTVGLSLQLVYAKTPSAVAGRMMWLLPCVYLLWKIKFFLAAVLVVLLATFLFTKWLSRRIEWLRSPVRQGLLGVAVLLLGALSASLLHENFTLQFLAEHTLKNYTVLLQNSDRSGPVLEFPGLEPTVPSLVRHAPAAVGHLLVRPLVWEGDTFFYRLAGLENLLVLFLVLLAVGQGLREKRVPRLPSFLAVLLVFFCISAVLVTLPTPNIGSLHRYRAPLLPFFLLVVLAWGPVPSWLNRLQNSGR